MLHGRDSMIHSYTLWCTLYGGFIVLSFSFINFRLFNILCFICENLCAFWMVQLIKTDRMRPLLTLLVVVVKGVQKMFLVRLHRLLLYVVNQSSMFSSL